MGAAAGFLAAATFLGATTLGLLALEEGAAADIVDEIGRVVGVKKSGIK